MSVNILFFIGLGLLIGTILIQQIIIGRRIRKRLQQEGKELSKFGEASLSPKETFWFGVFHTLLQAYVIIWSIYNIWAGTFSVLIGLVIIVIALWFIRKPVKYIRGNQPITSDFTLTLPHLHIKRDNVTPESILEVLSDESVFEIVKSDLKKSKQIGHKEQWRLGLLTPAIDTYDLSIYRLSTKERMNKFFFDPVAKKNSVDEIPIERAAIINPTPYLTIQSNRIMILNGKAGPKIQKYPGWSYPLNGEINKNEFRNIRDLEIDTDSPSARNRQRKLADFLREEGFPLKEHYSDGDPLTTERGGTIVVDKETIKVIYPNYFVQRRLIDDEGNLVYLGLDENFNYSATWNGVSVIPSVSKKLHKCVRNNQYVPIVRFRSFPYASNFLLPILDPPMSDSGWADLFINTQGKAKLYVAKDKTLDEWYEMMGRLRELFFGELSKTGYHLLGLTKDPTHLSEYFTKKQEILGDYFIIQNLSLA